MRLFASLFSFWRKISPASRTLSKRLLVLLCFLLGSIAGTTSFILWTETGAKLALKTVGQLSAGRLSWRGWHGHLANRFMVDELSYRDGDTTFQLQGLTVEWQWLSIWRQQLILDRVTLNQINIISVPSKTPAKLPTTLASPLPIDAKNLSINQFVLKSRVADGQDREELRLTDIQAEVRTVAASVQSRVQQNSLGNQARAENQLTATPHYQLKTHLTSPWGQLQLAGQLAMQAPYAVSAQVSLSGKALKEVPEAQFVGALTGDLGRLHLQAHASEVTGSAQQSGFDGTVSVEIQAFSDTPLTSLSVDLQHLNPASFVSGAPTADLNLQSTLRLDDFTSEQKAHALRGKVFLKNAKPVALDQQGLPIQAATFEFAWGQSQIGFKDVQVQLMRQSEQRKANTPIPVAQMNGEANLEIPKAGSVTLSAQAHLSSVDLSVFDRRIQASNISGDLRIQTDRDQVLHLQSKLHDPRADLVAEAQVNLLVGAAEYGLVKLHQFKLNDLGITNSQKKQVSLLAQGEFNLWQGNAFQLQGELHQFNPARWVKSPVGALNAIWHARGRIQPSIHLELSVPELKGDFAGQHLAGTANMQWQQNKVLRIEQMTLQIGANQLNAKGFLGSSDGKLDAELNAPDLAGLANIWAPWSAQTMSGKIQAQVQLHGTIDAPNGKINIQGQDLFDGKQTRLNNVTADVQLESGKSPQLDIQLLLNHLKIDPIKINEASRDIEQLSLSLHGKPDAHQLAVHANFDQGRQLDVQANGGLEISAQKNKRIHLIDWLHFSQTIWKGELAQLTLRGQQGLHLRRPVSLEFGSDYFQIKKAELTGELGNFFLDQFSWSPQSIRSEGRFEQVAPLDILALINPNSPLQGNLRLNGQWDLAVSDQIIGNMLLQRQSGDVLLRQLDHPGKVLPLGLNQLQLSAKTMNQTSYQDQQRIDLQLSANGARLGQVQLALDFPLQRQLAGTSNFATLGGWALPARSPLNGSLKANIPDITWLGGLVDAGIAMNGQLTMDGKINGEIANPSYQLQVNGKNLEVAFAAEGLLLPNGQLDAFIENKTIDLRQLQFSNVVSNLPQHAKFRDLHWLGQRGTFNATGKLNWETQEGHIDANMMRFPLVQRNDQWLLMSGQAQASIENRVWLFNGKMKADGAYFKVPKLPAPSLSSDVRVLRGTTSSSAAQRLNQQTGLWVDEKQKRNERPEENNAANPLKSRIEFNFDMGPHFVFVGRGIDAALAGQITLKSNDNLPLQASGSIRTEGGFYEGYNQRLEIERGILNFQGSPTNPALNIRALRKGLAVEAGVDVGGTVSAPQVRLISEPNVPDAEKLSWLVLGRAPDQLGGADTSLLFSAAGAIFGGDGSRNIPRQIVQTLGFDEFSVGLAENAGASKLPGQTIAGNTGLSAGSTDQVVSVGKRIAPGIVLSVERGLSDASGAVKLSWQLTRRLSIIGRSGNDSSVDANYIFSFH